MPDGTDVYDQGLNRWQSDATPQSGPIGYELQLLSMLGLGEFETAQLPIADCLYLDGNSGSQACVQPVALDASHDDARLLPGHCLEITMHEAQVLAASLNELWNPDGINVDPVTPIEWRLTGQASASLSCPPVSAIAYRSVADALPRRAEAAAWRQLLTEAQMLLHEHPVNVSRQQRGLRAINSIWCFGGAPLEAPQSESSVSLISNDAFTQGLAKKLGVDCQPLIATELIPSLDALASETVVIVDTSLQNSWLANDSDAFETQSRSTAVWLQALDDHRKRSKAIDYRIDDCEGLEYVSVNQSGVFSKIKRVLTSWH